MINKFDYNEKIIVLDDITNHLKSKFLLNLMTTHRHYKMSLYIVSHSYKMI